VVELLWAPTQQPPGRGPKPRLRLADVVAASIDVKAISRLVGRAL